MPPTFGLPTPFAASATRWRSSRAFSYRKYKIPPTQADRKTAAAPIENGYAKKNHNSWLASRIVKRIEIVKTYTGADPGAGFLYSFRGAARDSDERTRGALASGEASGRA